MPPQLAVVPLKRLWAGEMTDDRIVSELESFKPGVIPLLNDSRKVPFKRLLDTEYQLVYQDDENLLYALRSVVQNADP